jgi:hypothetical protein
MPSEDIADFLKKHATEVRGSLCVFGDWFGRPNDNWHSVTAYELKDGHLRLLFNEGETLDVWEPRGLRKEGKGLVIQGADRVRWEWFYYGRPKTPENHFFREHVVQNGTIEATCNSSFQPGFKPSLREPAVSIY